MKFVPHPRLGSANPPTQLEILVHAHSQIKAKYKTEADYLELLFKWVSEDRPQECHRCGCTDITRRRGARKGKCRKCRAEVSFTADTFFDGIKRPDAWATIILLTQEGIVFAGNQIHELVGIQNSSVANITLRVDFVLNAERKAKGLGLALRSAVFRPIYRKRSSKTPANEHPVAEEDAAEKEFEATDSLIPNANKNLQEPELLIDLEICSSLEGNRKIVFSVLSENPIHFEAICKATKLSAGIVGAELIMLELEDLVKSFPGDMYSLADRIKKTDSTQSPGPNPDQNLTFAGEVRVDRASMDALIFDFLQNAEAGDSLEGTAGDSNESFAKKASRFMIFVKEIYRGISRKYLQLYLARYWCLMDRTTWNSESSSLLKACARFRAISQAELRAFVSELTVQAVF